MKERKHMKTKTHIVHAAFAVFAFACLALIQSALAVSPPPDGGYPGGNTAEGQNALLSRSTGGFNTAIGWYSLNALTTANFNTGIGAGTLVLNNGDGNTAVGAGALLLNTAGAHNTAVGVTALLNNDSGTFNVAEGDGTLLNNTTGNENTAIGFQALFQNATTGFNTAVGFNALFSNTGNNNTAIGHAALSSNTSSNANTAVGGEALSDNTSGSQNTANGQQALSHNISGSDNVGLGFLAGSGVTTASNVICIGANVAGNNVDDSCFIGNIFGATSSNGVGVFVNMNGRLGTMTSSRRFKEEIKPIEQASKALYALKPVSFRYKKAIDPTGTPQFGLVAEEVQKVNPDLVVRDKDGQPYSIRYDQVNAMLLNEFINEHKAFLEEQRKVQKLEAALEAVNQRLKEQESKIERVSARVEVSKPGIPRMVNNQ